MDETKSITIKTETERFLFKRYEEERNERIKLENMVYDLKNQIEELQQHLKFLKEQNDSASVKTDSKERAPPSTSQYETDEEDLARETEWVRQKSRKKRKLNSTLSPPQNSSATTPPSEPKVKKTPLPPPIVIEGIKDYQKFYDVLAKVVTKDSFFVKLMNGEIVKINTKNEDSYRSVTKFLSETECRWHSYENKQDRPIRVMAKSLHSSCLPDKILEDLSYHGFKIQEAVNKKSWRNKEPLNMFMLSFHKDEDINKIYSIKSILGCKVEIQPLRTSKLIPQCKKCQAYGHTQKYCSKEPRCVKCTGKHLTRDCDKPADVKPKCVHCGEPHPASYRGCVVAKELQNIKNKLIKKSVAAPKPTQELKAKRTNKPTAKVTKNISYADITNVGLQPRAQPQPKNKEGNTSMEEKINKILNLMSSFNERLNNLENSAKVAKSKDKK